MASMDQRTKILEQLAASGVSRRSFLKQATVLGFSAVFASEFLAACSGSGSGSNGGDVSASPRAGGTFIEGYDRDFSPADPVFTPWLDPTMNAFYEALVFRNPEGQAVPMMVTGFSSDAGGWQFTLRDGLKFHSGDKVTPAAVVKVMKLMADPTTGLNGVFWVPVTDISASGQNVNCDTDGPFLAFQELITTESSYIANQESREAAGDQYGTTVVDGTGPFKLGEFKAGQKVTALKWTEYPGAVLPFLSNKSQAYLDGITWIPITQASQRANELESGNVDAVKNVPPQDIDRLKGNSDVTVVEFQELSNFFLALNLADSSLGFDDLRVRQAISQAIDRQAIVNTIFLGHAAATYGPAYPAYPLYNSEVEQFNKYDPSQAAALLDQAGWVVGADGIREKDGKKLSFTSAQLADDTEVSVMQAVVDMLKHVGIEMKTRAYEAAAFYPLQVPDTTSYAFRWLWSSPIDVVNWFIANTISQAPANAAQQTAFQKWQRAGTPDELKAAAFEYQRVVAEQLPIIPLYTPNTVWAANKKVVGWTPNQVNLYPLYNDVWLTS